MKSTRIYTQRDCNFCKLAKHLLDENNIEYEEVSLNAPRGLSYFRADCPDCRTVPQIFIDNVFIGNYKNLTEYFNENSTD